MRRVLAAHNKIGIAYIPFIDTNRVVYNISTRGQNITVNKGDGSPEFLQIPSVMRDFTDGGVNPDAGWIYSSAFTGNALLKIEGGAKSIYSLYLAIVYQNVGETKLNIQDFGTFINQFSNLFSLQFTFYTTNTDSKKPVIKGDLADIPKSVQRFSIRDFEVANNSTDVYFDFNTLNGSSLKWFKFLPDFFTSSAVSNNIKFIGDLGELPLSCNYFFLYRALKTSIINYTTKVWAPIFNTLHLGYVMNIDENNNVLKDLDDSVTTATGEKIIYLQGSRSYVSDLAVANLQAKGFNITCTRVLDLPSQTYESGLIFESLFQNNFNVKSLDNKIGFQSGFVNPTFVSGRKGSDYALSFNGSQSLRTSGIFPSNFTDKVSISFWIKTSQTSFGTIVELSPTIDNANAYAVYMNNNNANSMEFADHTPTGHKYNKVYTSRMPLVNWTHVVCTMDRSLGKDQSKIYVNGVLNFTQNTAAANYNDIDGLFGEYVLFLGRRNGASNSFVGEIAYLRFFNKILSPSEASIEYNKYL